MARRSRLLVTTLTFVGLLIIGSFILVRQADIPPPTGRLSVGRTVYRWEDVSRPETMTPDAGDHRELVAQIWYPAESRPDGPYAPYFADLATLRSALIASGEVSALEAFGLHFVRSHAILDAEVSSQQQRYPVLIFSPGNATNVSLYSAVLEELASHGYIVVALEHPYDVTAVSLAAGRVARYDAEQWPQVGQHAEADAQNASARFVQLRVETRAQDAIFALDQIVRLGGEQDGRFHGRLDLERIGIFGHSLGGMTAASACQLDPRLDACLNLDGLALGRPFYPDTMGNGPAQPFMLFSKALPEPSDAELSARNTTRQQWRQFQVDAEDRIRSGMNGLQSESHRVMIAGAEHEDFGDAPLLVPAIFNREAGAADRRMQIIRDYTRAFFDRTLRGQHGTLLDDFAPIFPEVTVEVFRSFLSRCWTWRIFNHPTSSATTAALRTIGQSRSLILPRRDMLLEPWT